MRIPLRFVVPMAASAAVVSLAAFAAFATPAAPVAPALPAAGSALHAGNAGPAANAGDSGDKHVLGTMVPDSRLVREVAFAIDDEDGADLAAATDGSWSDLACYEGKGQDPRLRRDVDVTWVVAWGRSGDTRVRAALASAPGNKVLAAKVLAVDPAGKADPDAFTRFLGQFVGRFGLKPTGNSWNPVSRLEEQLQAAKESSTEEGKKLSFLVRQLELMRHNQEASSRLFPAIQKKSKDAAKAAREIAAVFDELQTREADVAMFLGEDGAQTFEGKAASMQRTMEGIAKAVDGEDWAGAVEILRRDVQRGCGSCHGWDEHRLGGTLQNAFGALRGRLDIGPGYFVVGHDVEPDPNLPRDAQQAAAFAVKKAMLFPRVADLEE